MPTGNGLQERTIEHLSWLVVFFFICCYYCFSDKVLLCSPAWSSTLNSCAFEGLQSGTAVPQRLARSLSRAKFGVKMLCTDPAYVFPLSSRARLQSAIPGFEHGAKGFPRHHREWGWVSACLASGLGLSALVCSVLLATLWSSLSALRRMLPEPGQEPKPGWHPLVQTAETQIGEGQAHCGVCMKRPP